jgi:cell division protein FtsL
VAGTTRNLVAPITIVLAVATMWLAWVLPAGWNWIAMMVVVAALVVFLGEVCTGRLLGCLINEQKLMSLSRFQMLVWTIVIVSAYGAIAMERVKNGAVVEPLVVGVDWQVWALLGISTTSLIGTPLLNGNKTRKQPAQLDAQVQKTAQALGENPQEIANNRAGVLYENASVADARFTDMFEGEELANAQLLDVGKLQMFLFTIIIATIYGIQLYQLIAHNDLTDDVSLPKVNEGLLALLGVSHAGYLGTKGITQTPTS